MPAILKRKMAFLSVLVSLCSICKWAKAQDTLVTFYTHGSVWTSGIPGTKHDIYIGSIFDGTQRLFGFRDGFLLITIGTSLFVLLRDLMRSERVMRSDLRKERRCISM